jgi:DNA-binding NarL/FixJ family response regulator
VDIMTRTVRVLIVDDQEPFRTAARMVVDLTDGFEFVGEAATGEEGVQLVGELSPDLVLMDVKMPGIDGFEATRRIVTDDPEARVILVSTYDAGEFEQRALDARAIAFISKSELGPDELAAAWSEAG